MSSSDNTVSAAPKSDLPGDRWRAMAGLPAVVRQALHEGVVDWCPLYLRKALDEIIGSGWPAQAAAKALANALRRASQTEVDSFARKWPSRFGPYPHLAARATILRYDEAERVRAARRATLENQMPGHQPGTQAGRARNPAAHPGAAGLSPPDGPTPAGGPSAGRGIFGEDAG